MCTSELAAVSWAISPAAKNPTRGTSLSPCLTHCASAEGQRAKVRATAPGATDIDGPGDGCSAVGGGLFFGLAAQLGANAQQVAPRSLGVALAKAQALARSASRSCLLPRYVNCVARTVARKWDAAAQSAWRRCARFAGVRGSTVTASSSVTSRPAWPDEKPGSCGWPSPENG